MVNVDNFIGVGLDHLVGYDLHVACEDDEGDLLLFEQLHLCLLDFAFVRPVFLDLPYIIRYAELVGYGTEVFVVGHDAGDIDIEFACLIACEKVVEAMVHFRYKECHAWAYVAEVEAELHVVALCIEGTDVLFELLCGYEEFLECPFDTHEEVLFDMIDILVEVDDVSVVVGDELCDFCDDALLIGAV